MVTYNKERTAYNRAGYTWGSWYLLPRGRKRASFLGFNGPILEIGYAGYLVEYLTEEDREVLLDAEDEGVFNIVLKEVEHVLNDRYQAEQARKRRVAKEIVDSYLRD